MSRDAATWESDWSVKVRVWVERAGRAVLGKGRLELLEGIERHESISAAARQMGMSYRRAWLLVQSVNRAAGETLVEASVGGSHGGGARLTPGGRAAMTVFRALQERIRRAAAAELSRRVVEAGAPCVHVAAAVSLEEVLGQLLADYALEQPRVPVRAVFGGSDELADHLLQGAQVDLFLTASQAEINRLSVAGLVAERSVVTLAENGLAAIAPTRSTLRVSKAADLLRPAVRRIALAASTSPLGQYAWSYLAALNLDDAVRDKVLTVDNARAVAAAVRAGDADVGLVYSSDAMRAERCRILFQPRRDVGTIRYVGAVTRLGQCPNQAATLLEFLTSPSAASRFRRCGFRPVAAAARPRARR